jgi:cell division protease FtsH
MTEQGGKPPRREPGRMGGALTLLLVLAMALLVMKAFEIPGLAGEHKTFSNLMVLAYRDDVDKLSIRGDRLVDAKVYYDRKEEVWDSVPVPDYATDRLSELERLVAREFTQSVTVQEAVAGIQAGTWEPIEGYTIADPPVGKCGVFLNYAFGRRLHWAQLKGQPNEAAVDQLAELCDLAEVPLMPAPGGYADRVRFEPDNDIWGGLLITLIPWFLFIGFLMFLFTRQMRNSGGGGGIMSFGRSKVKMIPPDKAKVTFDQVAGAEEAKEEVQEIISFLKDPKRFSRLGGRVPRGVLLVGAPGTGKTLLAKAIAGEASVPFFAISGSDFVEMFVGVGASRVRDLFKQARENAPCVIFLDEIDAVGRKRGAGLGGGHDEREQTLNAILVEMDGFETDAGVIMIAATNRPDVLDAALMRPGRFDRQIALDLPDIRGREAILVVHSQKVVLADSVDLSAVARGTPMFSGAELEALMNEAALIATLKDKDGIEQDDLEEARDKVRFGRQKKSRVVIEEDRRVTAYHEAGHAMVASKLPKLVDRVHKVTIIPRGMALGSTMQLPERDKYHHRKNELKGMLAMLYGGRVAEELFCEDISGGASNDIERATEIARNMVCAWGMSETLGPVCYGEKRGEVFLGDELMRSRNFSEETSRAIDAEVRIFLDEAHVTARTILAEHREEMERLTEALMRYETISGDDVRAILDGATVDDLRPPEPEPDPPSAGLPAEDLPRHVPQPTEEDEDDGLQGTVPLPGPA